MAVLLGTANGFMLTGRTITMARIDPIVFPKGSDPKAGHVHNVVGSANFGVDSTFDTLSSASCTSVENTADKSAYWQPAIYSILPNSTIVPLPMYEARIYYLCNHGPNVTAPPKGLRMIGGDSMALDAAGNKTKGAKAATLGCQMGSLRNSTNEYQARGFPGFSQGRPLKCGAFLRASVQMPDCWDGIHLDSPDHFTHVAYSENSGLKCPSTHPVRMPAIVLEWGYDSKDYDPASLVLSSGDRTGYKLHADFFMGWDENVIAKAVVDPTCLKREDDLGDPGQCAALGPTHDDNAAANCKLATQVPQEPVGLTTPITELPGCNLLSDGSGGPKTCSAAQMNSISTTLVDPTYVQFGSIAPNLAIAK